MSPLVFFCNSVILGGSANDFHVRHQTGWVFRLLISCENVNLMIHHLGLFIYDEVALFFTLWHNGGPDYLKEKLQ